MPRFSIKARLITFFKNRRTVDTLHNEILLRKACVYTDTNLIQAAKKEIFMNCGAGKKVAPEIRIKVIFMRIAFELSPFCLWLLLKSVFKLADATQPASADKIGSEHSASSVSEY